MILSGVQVFLEGVKAALTADVTFNNGCYHPDNPPVVGLKACARVYAGKISLQNMSIMSTVHVLHCLCGECTSPRLGRCNL